MCPQSGNIQDLGAYIGHQSTFVAGSEAESDRNSRHSFVRPPSLPSDMGLRYMTATSANDVRFNPDSGTSHSSGFSVDSTIPSSTSSVNFSPHTNVFQPSLSSSAYSSNSSTYYSPLSSHNSVSDIKSRLSSIGSISPGMPPPSRSPAIAHLGSPINTRDMYATTTPQQLRRTSDIMSPSPSATTTLRGVPPTSPSSSSGFASPNMIDSSQLGNNSPANPPLLSTSILHTLQTADGQTIRPEICGRIEKGFFFTEGDWTCYRRNYFSLQCSFTLNPFYSTGPLHLLQGSNQSMQIYGFSMSIAAVVDQYGGKPIELVQHTPKRDKGPQGKPDRITLNPRPPPSFSSVPSYGGMSGDGSMAFGSQSTYDSRLTQSPSQSQTDAVFERIQFKQATANNGKRRAAQQYYHIVVELFADTGSQMGEAARWVKIAYRMSEQMVVRGRSPGHYHSDKRGSNASSGPSGPGGGPSAYNTQPGAISRGSGDPMSMSGASSMLSGSSYGGSYDNRSHQFSSSSAAHHEIPVEPIMSSEEARAIDETEGYQYYPSVLNEGHLSNSRSQGFPALPSYRDDRGNATMPQLPGMNEYVHGGNNPPRFKQEYTNGLSLPSLTTGPIDVFGRSCGRFEGAPTSHGYYPMVYHNASVDTS